MDFGLAAYCICCLALCLLAEGSFSADRPLLGLFSKAKIICFQQFLKNPSRKSPVFN
jgi:hypothetical protein